MYLQDKCQFGHSVLIYDLDACLVFNPVKELFLLFAELLAGSQYAYRKCCNQPSRHTFSFFFLCLFMQMLTRFPGFQVAAACVLRSPASLNYQKESPCFEEQKVKSNQIFNYMLTANSKSKFSGTYLKTAC